MSSSSTRRRVSWFERRSTRHVVFAGLLAAHVPLAAAGESAPVPSPDVRVLLSPATIDLVARALTERANRAFAVPELEKDLWSCGFGSGAHAIVRGLTFTLHIGALQVVPAQGKLGIQFVASVNGSGKVKAKKLACVAGDIGCDITFSISSVPVQIVIAPQVAADRVTLAEPQVEVGLDKKQLNIDVSGCRSAELLEELYKLFEEKVIDMLRSQVRDLVKDELADRLGGLLEKVSQLSGEAGDLRFTAVPTGVPTVDGGIGVDAEVKVEATEQASCALTGDVPAPPQVQPPKFSFRGEHVGLALSRTVLQEALVEVWRSGMLCIGEAEGGGLGGTISANAPNPPQVVLEPAGEALVEVLLPGVELLLQKDEGVNATMDVRVELRVAVDVSSAVLLSDPRVSIENLKAPASEEGSLDYGALLPELLPPIIVEQLRDIPLLPRVLAKGVGGGDLGEYYLHVTRTETTAEHVLAYADLFAQNVADKTPPETELVDAPEGWTKKKVVLRAQGNDDDTPEGLLRYAWRVDGGEWSKPDGSASFEAELESGEHTIAVVAIDLNDNGDPSPAESTFRVDGVAPTIKIVQAPPDVVEQPKFVVVVELEDDVAAADRMAVRIVLDREASADEAPESADTAQAPDVDPDAANAPGEDPDEIASRRAGYGRATEGSRTSKAGAGNRVHWEGEVHGKREIELTVLGRGQHTLTLFAEDLAGNRSLPAQALFESKVEAPVAEEEGSSNVSGGCGVAGSTGPRSGTSWLVLASLMVLWIVVIARRRSHEK